MSKFGQEVYKLAFAYATRRVLEHRGVPPEILASLDQTIDQQSKRADEALEEDRAERRRRRERDVVGIEVDDGC